MCWAKGKKIARGEVRTASASYKERSLAMRRGAILMYSYSKFDWARSDRHHVIGLRSTILRSSAALNEGVGD